MHAGSSPEPRHAVPEPQTPQEFRHAVLENQESGDAEGDSSLVQSVVPPSPDTPRDLPRFGRIDDGLRKTDFDAAEPDPLADLAGYKKLLLDKVREVSAVLRRETGF